MLKTSIRESLLDKVTMLKAIPTASGIVGRALDLISNPDLSFNDLTDIIRYDYSITAKIISISNSVYYSRGLKVLSLKRAMMVMGFEEVKKVVMCLLFMNGILKRFNLKETDIVSLWKHSASVACAARTLSKKMLVEEPQKVFAIALLHDIGKTVMHMSADGYSVMLRNATTKAKDLVVMEQEMYGVDHQEIGYALGMKWHFPEEILYAIRCHHEASADKYENLLRLVRAADEFALPTNRDPGPEGFILLNEREAIVAEIERMAEYLRLE